MLERMPKFLLIAALVAVAMPQNVSGEPAAEKNIRFLRAVEKKGEVLVFCGDRPVLRYRRSEAPMKPYVDQLFSPAGVQVLRDSPHDHKHHHALMFGTTVDGVDFWGESPPCGMQRPRSFETAHGLVLLRAHSAADFIERFELRGELDWTAATTNKPLLIEHREVRVLGVTVPVSPDYGATLVEWQSKLQTPSGKNTAVLSGAHYVGLGMRFVQSMDTGGRFFNADGKQGEIVRGDERVTPVKWSAYTAKADGKPVTVAIFDHPENLRHPAVMFTMSTPFAYLSATCNVWKEPITIKAGQPLDLCYGVAVWDGAVDKKTVEALYQRWLKLRPNGSTK